ncbi:MAG: BolA family transcriptional regulator [Nitrospirae bacterium]|nr:BolA family transcriptional regulator [Candidatus Manganitrophaceae bacterium]
MGGATQQKIERKMKEALGAVFVEVIDESWKHAGHAGAASGGGHFILQVVSDRFEGVSLLNRNRLVFSVLKEEMGAEIHALSIKAITPQEWKGIS